MSEKCNFNKLEKNIINNLKLIYINYEGIVGTNFPSSDYKNGTYYLNKCDGKIYEYKNNNVIEINLNVYPIYYLSYCGDMYIIEKKYENSLCNDDIKIKRYRGIEGRSWIRQ